MLEISELTTGTRWRERSGVVGNTTKTGAQCSPNPRANLFESPLFRQTSSCALHFRATEPKWHVHLEEPSKVIPGRRLNDIFDEKNRGTTALHSPVALCYAKLGRFMHLKAIPDSYVLTTGVYPHQKE